MADFFQANLAYIAVAVESTKGTAETLTSSDFNIRARNIEISPAFEVDNESSKYATGDHTKAEHLAGLRAMTINFIVQNTPGTTVTTSPNWEKLEQGAGSKVNTYTGSGIAYTPEASEDEKCVTIGFYMKQLGSSPAGKKIVLSGAVANCQVGADGIVMPWERAYSFTGKVSEVSDITYSENLELTSPQSTLPPTNNNVTLTMGGTQLYVTSWQLDYGNTVEPVYDLSDPTGILYYKISDRDPRITINPLEVPNSTYNWFNIFINNTAQAFSIAAPNNAATITAPRCQLLPPSATTREGLNSNDFTFRPLRNTSGGNKFEKERAWTYLQGHSTGGTPSPSASVSPSSSASASVSPSASPSPSS